MMGKIDKFCILIFVFFLLFLSGCETLSSYRITKEKDWLEGKPFPVSISFTYNKLVEDCTLYYSVNRGETRVIPLEMFGSDYGYSIPGEQIVEGELLYFFTVSGKGKEYTSTTYRVTILNFRQAKEKYTRELSSRIFFQPPGAVPYFDDAVFSLYVNKHKPDTDVVLNFKKKIDTEYKRRPLESVGMDLQGVFLKTDIQGRVFQGIISQEEIQDGYHDYFFTVTEYHQDVGLLTVTIPGEADRAPYSLSILDNNEMYALMQEEMEQSISCTPPQTVPVTKDLVIQIAVIYPEGSYLAKYENNRREAVIHYGIQNLENTSISAAMTRENNIFYYRIEKEELERGYNTFYVDIQDTLDHVGIIHTTYPENGTEAPFVYRIQTKEELVADKKADVYSRISHISPETVDGITDLVLTLDFLSITEKTEVRLHYKQSGMTTFKYKDMNKNGNSFQETITAEELQENYNEYYFTITLYDDIAGMIVLDHPPRGEWNYYSFHIEDKKNVYQRLVKNLRDKITFTPVTRVSQGNPLKLTIDIDDPGYETEVLIHYRRDTDRRYIIKSMSKTWNKFSGDISEYELQQDYNRYYIEVREPHDFFEYISVTFPHGGPVRPYKVTIIPGETDEENSGIDQDG